MFLLFGLVVSSYVAGTTFKLGEHLEIIRYLTNHALLDDSGCVSK
jgi:hypothetical protein